MAAYNNKRPPAARPSGGMSTAGGPQRRGTGNKELDYKLAIFTAGIGVVTWAISLLVYYSGMAKGSMVSSIAIIFFVLAAAVPIGVLVYSAKMGTHNNDGNIVQSFMAIGGGAIVILIVAALLEWIYELNIGGTSMAGLSESDIERLAGAIGGKDLADIADGIMDLGSKYIKRNLFSIRFGLKLDLLYTIMRVTFITILGTAIGLLAAYVHNNQGDMSFTFVVAIAKAFLAGILVEIGSGILVLPDIILWLIAWILIATTLVESEVRMTGARGARLR